MCPVLAFVVITAIDQQPEPTVSKDSLSVHRVERGDMPLREVADGSISSIAPPRATVIVSAQQQARLRIGQTCTIQIAPPAVLAGRVGRIKQSASKRSATVELELADALPEGTSIGAKVGGLIDVGVAKDALFFGRPTPARKARRASSCSRRTASTRGESSSTTVDSLAR
jgi:hypothetical protein